MRAALYLRVSTDQQTTDRQERELREVAQRTGWAIVEVYRDHGISGASARRPAFDALCKDAARRRFDVVMAWSVDRLGRSLQGLVAFLSDLHALRVDLFLHQQGIDTTTPAGKAMFQMMGVFAEFERAMISERVKSGLNSARAKGKKLGRPRVSKATEEAIARDHGSVRALAAKHRVSVGTVQRIKSELPEAPIEPTSGTQGRWPGQL
ncbi:recombinase family protein [Mesorhizobium sp. B2-4-14]|uniref:recombinase family protein n=1 Tax=Mesorhizobium sp. B2-4-14 TaxID=2589935 RepID=UPI00112E40B9|nr:recombinase family protein [Mesorhizobium sp. B2-4-14]TPL00676.1 recombinase family protein [Mesorhizobium sp. B2-4-14]